ncbi:thioesterase family protein [Maricaulis sp.]|uniref:thioesterase family protein n=1 Tax=Maricaulis sp. TaxID=1486257 RepID=UPI002630310B|nr:thioesterase family protein [Maricaulis sp.]
MIELWRGNANAWECDELGHMNVQFYLAKASEAVANLAALAGLGNIFRADAYATLAASSLHIKFLAEARPGAPLMIEGGITGTGPASLGMVLIMRHAGSGQVAASFRIEANHVAPKEGRPFDWPERFAAHAAELTVATPDIARPRGLSEAGAETDISIERADALGLEQIGMGRFNSDEMSVFGRIRSDILLGRVSNSVVNFRGAFPEEVDFHMGKSGARIGSALLECRILPRRWPRAGDGYVIRSGLTAAASKVRNLVHWVLDPETGRPWWTMEGVAAPMDLDQRKLIEPDPAARAALDAALKPGLRA